MNLFHSVRFDLCGMDVVRNVDVTLICDRQAVVQELQYIQTLKSNLNVVAVEQSISDSVSNSTESPWGIS